MSKFHSANVWIFNQSVKCAQKNDIPFDLSKEELMLITDRACSYCGEEPKNFKRSLVDRAIPKNGYTKSNAVPACSDCVRAKGSCSANTFIARACHVSYVNGGMGRITDDWNNVKFKPFEQYRAENIHKNFKLTPDEYYELRNGNCSYCFRETTKTHTNGIDRLNNNVGYVKDNCVSCCHDCNILKLVSTPDDFLNHMRKVARYTESIK
ncbi:hypothetical protein PBCVCZ2_654R [Paramecium bursaria Chlorella virus CZ-2]|nr:hypothetical protein PBCVCZ2_654R [Paramecium bursaria Chlorella virus CZ-2]